MNNTPEEKKYYKVPVEMFKDMDFHVDLPTFVCSCGEEVLDTSTHRAQSTLSEDELNMSISDTATTDLIPGISLSEDWRERFREKFHLYKMENPRDVMVEHLSGEIEDFIAQIETEAYDRGKKETFYTKSPVPSRESLVIRNAELSLLSKLREKVGKIERSEKEIACDYEEHININQILELLSEFEVKE